MKVLLAGAALLALTSTSAMAGSYGGSGGSGGGMYTAPQRTAPPRAAPTRPAAPAQRLLTDSRGRTLYVYDRDGRGVSNCAGGCAREWPPFLAPAGATAPRGYSLVQRSDGRMQWALGAHPLYRWSGDRRPGDAGGNGIDGVWHVVPL